MNIEFVKLQLFLNYCFINILTSSLFTDRKINITVLIMRQAKVKIIKYLYKVDNYSNKIVISLLGVNINLTHIHKHVFR